MDTTGQADGTVTGYLVAIGRGDPGAKAKLWDAVEDELRSIAEHLMRSEPAGHVLQTTALVNEAYLRLKGGEAINTRNRAYFFRAAVRAMRRILVEHARRGATRRRTLRRERVPEAFLSQPLAAMAADELDSLDDALRELEIADIKTYDVVTFRALCGLTVDQTAELLGIGVRTVKRRWRYGRTWLYRQVRGDERGDPFDRADRSDDSD